eukprot:scaffold6809_cov56-Phaeocystis_antarctica.AAC.1
MRAQTRAASPPCSADSHAPQTRPTVPRPGAAASAGRGGSQGRSRARSSAARRAAVRGARAWARWRRCWRRCSREHGWQAVEWARRWARHGLVRWSGTRARRWWASRASRARRARRTAGRLLEFDRDAAAGGVFDGSFGLVVKVIVLGVRWAREHARPTRPAGGRGRGPRGARCIGQHRVDGNGEGACAFASECRRTIGNVFGKGKMQECVPFLTRREGRDKCSEMCQRALTRKQTLRGRRRTLDK